MNLYLSRLVLDVRSRQVAAELAHPYEMHRTLMRAFPGMSGSARGSREEFGVLFRPDVDELRDTVRVYVQSWVEPDWSFLCRMDHYLSSDSSTAACECRDIANVLRRIEDGQVLAFRLRANPTRRIGRKDDPMRGKRVELRREDEYMAWLAEKGRGGRDAVPGGFELLTSTVRDDAGHETQVPRVQVRREGKFIGMKSAPGSGHRTTHLSVVFDGLLRVTDSRAFVDTVRLGVGGGKAFGFGLLSIGSLTAPKGGPAT